MDMNLMQTPPPNESPDIVDTIIRLFEIGRRRDYSMNSVSHTEHALQAALFAEDQALAQSLVVAALVHDIGLFLEPWPRDIAHLGTNHCHEQLGSDWLARVFGPEVTEPVRLHVAAKRYLCAEDADYLNSLSPSSLRGLELQGGPMSRAKIAEFERETYFDEALKLCRIDEASKQPGMTLPDIEDCRGWLESMLPYHARS